MDLLLRLDGASADTTTVEDVLDLAAGGDGGAGSPVPGEGHQHTNEPGALVPAAQTFPPSDHEAAVRAQIQYDEVLAQLRDLPPGTRRQVVHRARQRAADEPDAVRRAVLAGFEGYFDID